MKQTGRTQLHLYGCSTTSVVTNPFESGIESLISQPDLSTPSLYSTSRRMSHARSEDKNTDSLNCVTCPFCNQLVDATIENGRIVCPQCKESAPYSKTE